MVKNIIFDLGNVVFEFNPKQYIMDKIADKSKIAKVSQAIFKSDEWAKLDEGKITEEEAIEIICTNNSDLDNEVRLIFDNWYPILKPIESTIEIIKDLKAKGFKLLYLSNFHSKAFDYVNNEHEFFKLFEGGVVSYQDALLKPNEKIYKLILERYDLDPAECVFIDDTKENIDAAKECGMNGIYLENPSDLKEHLSRYI